MFQPNIVAETASASDAAASKPGITELAASKPTAARCARNCRLADCSDMKCFTLGMKGSATGAFRCALCHKRNGTILYNIPFTAETANPGTRRTPNSISITWGDSCGNQTHRI